MPVTITGSNTPTAGGITYGDGTTYATTAAGTSGQILQSNGASAPTWVASPSPSAATPTALGTVYGKQTASGASPYLTAYGYEAGPSSTGPNNVLIGYQAGYNQVGGEENTFVGFQAGLTNVSSYYLTAVGYRALASNTSGLRNTALGYALFTNTTGGENVAIGHQAMGLNTTGTDNVSVGKTSLYDNTTGNYNTAIGSEALRLNTTASYNTALGYQALYTNTTTSYNTALGYSAGFANTTGGITAVGAGALAANTTGYANTALGGYDNATTVQAALRYNTTGYSNVAVGTGALTTNTTGYNNTCLGYQAGYPLTTGTGNVFIGISTGKVCTTGSANIHLGYDCRTSSAGVGNEIVISTNSDVGKGAQTGFIAPGFGSCYQGSNGANWAVTSDIRLKKNIIDNNVGLEKLTQIQVRNFEYRLPDEVDAELKPSDAIKKTGVQLGVIAQELQTILPECVKTESTGVMSVNADNLTWYMINAIKEQQALITTLTERITALEGV